MTHTLDYLALVRDRHTQRLTDRVNYAALTDQATDQATTAGVLPGQTDLLDLLAAQPAVHDEHDAQELS